MAGVGDRILGGDTVEDDDGVLPKKSLSQPDDEVVLL